MRTHAQLLVARQSLLLPVTDRKSKKPSAMLGFLLDSFGGVV